MESFLKKTGWESILTSVVFAIVGILLICNPEGTFKFAATILGIIFIAFGLVKIIKYFTDKGSSDFYNYDLIYGLVAAVAGIVIIIHSGALEVLFGLIIGIWIIYSGIMRITLATKLKAMNLETWIPVLVIAILMILCGLVMIVNANAVTIAIGTIILVYAIMDLIEGFIFVKNVDKSF